MQLFRGKLLAALAHALERGKLRLPADSSRERVRSMLNRLGRKKWNVHLRARYAHGAGVAAYLARYLLMPTVCAPRLAPSTVALEPAAPSLRRTERL